MDTKREGMNKNLTLYGMIVITAIISVGIAIWIMGIASSNAGLAIYVYFIILGPILIVGFIIFSGLQRTSLAKFVNKRNVGIICIIMAILIVAPAINFTINALPPSELLYDWSTDDGQLINGTLELYLYYDNTYAQKKGNFFHGHNVYDILWDYDRNSNKLTFWDHGPNPWEVSLRIEFTKDNKMTTYYISSENVPFDAELFDGISWTGVKWLP